LRGPLSPFLKKMKKSQLRNIIRESIDGLLTEQGFPVPTPLNWHAFQVYVWGGLGNNYYPPCTPNLNGPAGAVISMNLSGQYVSPYTQMIHFEEHVEDAYIALGSPSVGQVVQAYFGGNSNYTYCYKYLGQLHYQTPGFMNPYYNNHGFLAGTSTPIVTGNFSSCTSCVGNILNPPTHILDCGDSTANNFNPDPNVIGCDNGSGFCDDPSVTGYNPLICMGNTSCCTYDPIGPSPEDCCEWCQTGPFTGNPPAGCEDWMCTDPQWITDNCPELGGGSDDFTDLETDPEIQRMQDLANIR